LQMTFYSLEKKPRRKLMFVLFCGVGEAFDENLTNTSILVFNKQQESLLLDCGFTAATNYWKYAPHPLDLDGLYISHLHGDHFLGTSLLLLRFYEEQRTKELHIFGPAGIKEKTLQALELAYPKIKDKLPFSIVFTETCSEQEINFKNFTLLPLTSIHAIPSLGVKISSQGKSLYYSGDGQPDSNLLNHLKEVDLLILETYKATQEVPGHSSITSALHLAKTCQAKELALVHLNRDTRKDSQTLFQILQNNQGIKVLLPAPGTICCL